ncbi:hypothetical protein TNCV_4345061 [Trichonephila clavipes]|nr:hypothetical protein TNCV_4345061 [Trichonephila clavipes]
MKANLIASWHECPKCRKDMSLQEQKGTVDGYEWHCRSQSKDNPHVIRNVKRALGLAKASLAYYLEFDQILVQQEHECVCCE